MQDCICVLWQIVELAFKQLCKSMRAESQYGLRSSAARISVRDMEGIC